MRCGLYQFAVANVVRGVLLLAAWNIYVMFLCSFFCSYRSEKKKKIRKSTPTKLIWAHNIVQCAHSIDHTVRTPKNTATLVMPYAFAYRMAAISNTHIRTHTRTHTVWMKQTMHSCYSNDYYYCRRTQHSSTESALWTAAIKTAASRH